MKDMPPEERSGPAPKPPGIQVAHEDSGNGLVTIPGLTLTGLGVDPKAVKDLGDKIDGILGNAWDAAKDAPLLGVGRYGPLGPNLRDMLGEDEQQVIDKAPPQDAPDLDTQETFPDQSDDRGFGGTLVFPDGNRYDDLTKLPPSEDQSGLFPKGTVLEIRNSKGEPSLIDASGAGPDQKKTFDASLEALKQRNMKVFDTLHEITGKNAKLTTSGGMSEGESNIDISVDIDPLDAAIKDFGKLVDADGADPSVIEPKKGSKNGVRVYATENGGFKINVRNTSTATGKPTVEVQIEVVGRGGLNKVKCRYSRKAS